MTDNEQLNLRRTLAKHCIDTLDQMPEETEGRTEALAEYKRQLQSIDDKIFALTGEYPHITVALKTAVLFGESKMNEKE